MQALEDSRDPLAHGQTLLCSWAPADKQGLPGTRVDGGLPGDPHFRTSQEPGKLPFRSLRLTTDHVQHSGAERQAPPTHDPWGPGLKMLLSRGPRVWQERGRHARKPESDVSLAPRDTWLQKDPFI